MAAQTPDRFRRNRLVSAALSLLFHLALLLGGGRLLAQPAEYGIEAGTGGMELHLVAALPPSVSGEPVLQRTVPARQADPGSDDEAFAVDEPAALESVQLPAPVLPIVGDGSSPMPGQDATTLHSAGGGQTSARPNYLKNPVPPYPLEARRLGQQGLVLLRVAVDARGQAERVELAQRSGFSLLDASAVTTVRRWKFRPARVGGLPVACDVEVPIRFTLEADE